MRNTRKPSQSLTRGVTKWKSVPKNASNDIVHLLAKARQHQFVSSRNYLFEASHREGFVAQTSPHIFRKNPEGSRQVDSKKQQASRTWHRSTTIQVHQLSESLVLVDDCSVQLVSTLAGVVFYQKTLNTYYAVTLGLAAALSPIDASLVPSVNRHSVGSCLCRGVPSTQTSALLCHARQETRHFLMS